MEDKLLNDFFEEEKYHWWHVNKRLLIENYVDVKHKNILVLGIGGGLICKELEEKGHNVIGIDIAEKACLYGRKKLSIKTVNADLEKSIPFKNGCFDLIIATDVLEHLENDKKLIRECHTILNDSGILLITVPAYMHMWSQWDERLEHKRRYSCLNLKENIIQSDFKIMKSSYTNTALYPAAFIYRRLSKIFTPKNMNSKSSDFSVSSTRFLSIFFNVYFKLERQVMQFISLPFGLSIFIKAQKNG